MFNQAKPNELKIKTQFPTARFAPLVDTTGSPEDDTDVVPVDDPVDDFPVDVMVDRFPVEDVIDMLPVDELDVGPVDELAEVDIFDTIELEHVTEYEVGDVGHGI